jgi:hypothetical protein
MKAPTTVGTVPVGVYLPELAQLIKDAGLFRIRFGLIAPRQRSAFESWFLSQAASLIRTFYLIPCNGSYRFNLQNGLGDLSLGERKNLHECLSSLTHVALAVFVKEGWLKKDSTGLILVTPEIARKLEDLADKLTF